VVRARARPWPHAVSSQVSQSCDDYKLPPPARWCAVYTASPAHARAQACALEATLPSCVRVSALPPIKNPRSARTLISTLPGAALLNALLDWAPLPPSAPALQAPSQPPPACKAGAGEGRRTNQGSAASAAETSSPVKAVARDRYKYMYHAPPMARASAADLPYREFTADTPSAYPSLHRRVPGSGTRDPVRVTVWTYPRELAHSPRVLARSAPDGRREAPLKC